VNKSKVLFGLLKEPELNVLLDDDDEDVSMNEDGKPAKVYIILHIWYFYGLLSLCSNDVSLFSWTFMTPVWTYW